MKKKLLALILAATMAFPVYAFADDAEEETATEAVAEEETEAASSILVMQGTDDNGIVWTIAINTENAKGCVSLTPQGEDTTYVTVRSALTKVPLLSQMRRTDRIRCSVMRMFPRQRPFSLTSPPAAKSN